MSVSGIPDEYVELVSNQFDNNAEDLKTARNQYSRLVQQTMQIGQWIGFKATIDSMPDAEAIVMCFAYFNFPKDQTELENAVLTKSQENNVTSATSALYMSPTEFIDDSIAEYVSEKLNESHPSEEFILDSEDGKKIEDFWSDKKRDLQGIPSDLLFSKKLPVLDCIITISQKNNNSEYESTTKSRICVFPDYQDRINALSHNQESVDIENLFLGAMIHYVDNPKSDSWQLIVPFGSQPDGNILIGFQPYTKGLPEEQKEKISTGIVYNIINKTLATWYGVEFALYGGIQLESKKLQ